MQKKGAMKIWAIIIAVLITTTFACSSLTGLIPSSDPEALTETQDDILYPGAELLFDVIPFGTIESGDTQHLIRWQIFYTSASLEQVESHHDANVSGWSLVRDEVINDHRYIEVTSTHPLSGVMERSRFEQVVRQQPNLRNAKLDIEVLDSSAHANEGRLSYIFDNNIPPNFVPAQGQLSIPPETTLIILADYFKQDADATPTPEPTPRIPQTMDDLSQVCMESLETSLCANPYFAPVEGMKLVYLVDGHRQQTRQIGLLETNIQEAGEPRMDSFSVTFTDDQFTGEMTYYCTEEGLTGGDTSSMINSVLQAQDVEGGQVEVVSTTFEGVALPNDIAPGDTWEAVVEVVLSAPDGVNLVSRGHSRYFFEGFENITVKAGTFTAQKIHIDMTVDVTANLPDGHSFQVASVNIVTVTYQVECLGMVKSQGDTNLELVEVILP